MFGSGLASEDCGDWVTSTSASRPPLDVEYELDAAVDAGLASGWGSGATCACFEEAARSRRKLPQPVVVGGGGGFGFSSEGSGPLFFLAASRTWRSLLQPPGPGDPWSSDRDEHGELLTESFASLAAMVSARNAAQPPCGLSGRSPAGDEPPPNGRWPPVSEFDRDGAAEPSPASAARSLVSRPEFWTLSRRPLLAASASAAMAARPSPSFADDLRLPSAPGALRRELAKEFWRSLSHAVARSFS
mmetsp:Transcript_5635/g.9328  ORF Transcript_5635/g.9328 Transcript_5635/m.9328 type:complete len:245 (-) Transcript_5635:271-1005(-)